MNGLDITDKSSLDDNIAIVTGGTVGIGRAVCLALAGQGANIVVVGRNKERLEQTIAELKKLKNGTMPTAMSLDVRKEADMEEMVKRTVNQYGRIDILVTAAGILRAKGGFLKTLVKMTSEEWEEVLDTNLKGVFLSNRAVLPIMVNQRSGNIVNISSTSGRTGFAYDTAYCASKFGVIGLTEALAIEMRQYGIRVQVVLPGAIETGMWNQNGPLPTPREILSPDRVADIILYMVAQPDDTVISTPVIEPFKTRILKGWIG